MGRKRKNRTEAVLARLYFTPSAAGSFGGIDALYQAVKEVGGRLALSRHAIERWLQKQDTYTLHKGAVRKFRRRKVIVGGIDHQWQIDLVDVSRLSRYNDGYKFLLMCIDVFSKYTWAVPLKSKTGVTLVQAFGQILTDSGRKPLSVQSDKGTEFVNRHFQAFLAQNNIHFFTTHNVETKASIVERVNRTIKSKMWKAFTHNNTLRYVDMLPDIIKSYNNTYHSSIKMKPSMVSPKNQETVWQRLYGGPTNNRRPKRSIGPGDRVRITIAKRPFKKGYLPQWSDEVFTVDSEIPGAPTVYKIKDDDSEILDGTFYPQELQRVDKSDGVYRIERILEEKKLRGVTYYLVKWKGYSDKFNSWIKKSDFRQHT